MKSVPSFIKSGIFISFFLLFLAAGAWAQSFGTEARLTNPVLQPDGLHVTLELKRQSWSPQFNLGTSYFVLKVDTTVLDVFKSKFDPSFNGRWSDKSSPDYLPLYKNYDPAYNIFYVKVSQANTRAGGGLSVSSTTNYQPIARLVFPVKKCFDKSDLIWVESEDYLKTWYDNSVDMDIDEQYNLTANPACLPPDGTISISQSQTICPKEAVTFTANVTSGVADSVIFYVNGIIAQKGKASARTFTTSSLNDGDNVQAFLKYCTCGKTTNSIKINILKSGSVNLGKDTILCPGASLTLNANPANINTGVNYDWSTKAITSSIFVNTPGNYSVKVSTKNGKCFDEDTIEVRYEKNITDKPKVVTENASQNSIKFSWQPVANAKRYKVSRDGVVWLSPNGGTNAHSFSGLPILTTQCIYVRAINDCDSVVSDQYCGATLGTCTITYLKTPDTVGCGTPFNTLLTLKNINIPAYKVKWETAAATRNLTYNAGGNVGRYVVFTVFDSTSATCSKKDSIKITPIVVDATWSGLKSSYCISSYPDKLTPVHTNGVFVGAGIVRQPSGDWFFDPNVAGAGTIKIKYIICTDTVTKTTVVNPAPCLSSIVSSGSNGLEVVSNPQGIFTACDGSIYYSSTDSNRIYKISPFGNLELIAGPVGLNKPIGLTVHPVTGEIYFADSDNNQIKKIDPVTKIVSVVAGSGVAGYQDAVIGASARFYAPIGLTLSPDLNSLYVADATNYVIRKVDIGGLNQVTTFAGQYNTPGADNGDRLTAATFYKITQLAADSNYLYLTEPDVNSIRKISFKTGLVEAYFTPKFNYVDGNSSVFATRNPSGISVDGSGNIYFTDNCAVRRSDVKTIKTLAGGPPPIRACGTGINQFTDPTALSVFVKGFVDIADDNTIKRVSLENWKSSPFIGLQKKFCVYDGKDTLQPLYVGGTYSSKPVAAAVSFNGGDGRWYFNPQVAGVGQHTIAYAYKVGYCTDTFYTSVYVGPRPTPSLGKDTTVCANELGTYKLYAGEYFKKYHWFHNSDSLSVQEATKYLTVNSVGRYVVKVTDTIGCTNSDTVDISSQPLPIIKLPKDTSICSGQTILLDPVPVYSTIKGYLWQDGRVDTAYVASTSGKYYVEVAFSSGCKSSDTLNLTINPLPALITDPDGRVCMGKTLNLNVFPDDILKYKYKWSNPSDPAWSSSVPHLVVNPVSSTVYDVNVTDSFGCTSNVSRFVEVVSPQAVASADKLEICPGTSAKLNVSTFGGFGNPTLFAYKWTPDINLSASNLASVSTSTGIPRTYIVEVIDEEGCIALDSVSIDVVNPVFKAYSKAEEKVCAKTTVSLGIGTEDTLNFNYYWSKNSDPNTIVASPFVANPNRLQTTATSAVGDSAYVYLIVKHKAEGCIKKDSVRLIFDMPFVDAGNDTTVCLGDTITLRGKSGPGNYSWASATPVKFLTAVNIRNPKAVIYSNTKFKLSTVNPLTGCVNSDSVDISIRDLEISLKTNPSPVCSDAPIKFDIDKISYPTTIEQFSWQWTNVNGNPYDERDYTVIYKDKTYGCRDTAYTSVKIFKVSGNAGPDELEICLGKSKTIGTPALPKYKYKWTAANGAPAVGLSNDTIAQPVATGISDRKYYLTARDTNGCVAKDSILIRVIPLPVFINVSNDTMICNGGTAILKIDYDKTKYFFDWDPETDLTFVPSVNNPTAKPKLTTVYKAILTDKVNLCTNQDSIKISVFSPVVSASVNINPLCFGDSATITSVVLPGTAAGSPASWKYKWTTAAIPAGINNAASANPRVSPQASALYSLSQFKDSIGCAAPIISVPVNIQKITANAGPDKTICAGETTTIGTGVATAGYEYIWTPSGNLSDPGMPVTNANPAATSTYLLTVRNTSTSCQDTNSVLVRVNPLPDVSAGADKFMCKENNVSLTASSTKAPVSFSWKSLTDGTISSGNNISHKPSVTTDYEVTVTQISNGISCTNKDTLTVFVIDPILTASVLPDSICKGSSAQLTATVNGNSGAGSYLWSGGPLAGNQNTIFNPLAIPLVSSVYTVQYTDPIGCVRNAAASVNIRPVIADAGPDLRTICTGDSVELGTTQLAGFTYSWKSIPAGASISSSNTATTFVKPSADTKYILSVSDINGCTSIDSADIVVLPSPLLSPLKDTTICITSSASFKAPTSATDAWWTTGTGAPVKSLTYTAQPGIDTRYELKIKDVNGCYNYDTVWVYLSDPKVTVSASPASICPGETSLLSVSFQGIGAAKSYNWSGASLSDSSIANPKVSPAGGKTVIDYTYLLTVTDQLGCEAKGSTKVTVQPRIAEAGPDQSVCIGSIGYKIGSATVAGLTYSWSTLSGNANASLSATNISQPEIITKAAGTAVFVLTTTSAQCTDFDTVIVKVNGLPVVQINNGNISETICKGTNANLDASAGPFVYSWLPGSATTQKYTPQPADTIVYTVNVQDTITKCYGSATIKVNVVDLLVTIKPSAASNTICGSDSLALTAEVSGGYGIKRTYLWTPTGRVSYADTLKTTYARPVAPATTFYVNVIDEMGCSSTANYKINVYPVNTVAGPDTKVCLNDSVQIGSNFTYKTLNWTGSDGKSVKQVTKPYVTPLANALYTLKIEDLNGCIIKDTVFVTVLPRPKIQLIDSIKVCKGQSAILKATPGYNQYIWTPAGGIVKDSIYTVIANSTQKYFVAVQSGLCTNSDSIVVLVSDPVVKITPSDTSLCINSTAILKATMAGGYKGIASYVWTGGKYTGSGSVVTAVPDAPSQTYTVSVTDNLGCPASTSATVKLFPKVADAGKDALVCIGDSIRIGRYLSGAVIYKWTGPGNFVSADSVFNVKPTGLTNYQLTVTDINGCITTDDIVLNINSLPAIDAGAAQRVCKNGEVTLTAISDNASNVFNWRAHLTLAGTTGNIQKAKPVDTTYYMVEVINPVTNCKNRDSVLVMLIDPKAVALNPDGEVCKMVTSQLNSALTGGIGTASQWKYKWTPTYGIQGSDAVSDPVVKPGADTTYTVTITDAIGCVASASVKVLVSKFPVDAGLDYKLCPGGQVQIGPFNDYPDTKYFYRWKEQLPSGQWINAGSVDDSTVRNPVANPLKSTKYQFQLYEKTAAAEGCQGADIVTVSVKELFSLGLKRDTSICEQGDDLLLKIDSVQAGTTITWSPDLNLNTENGVTTLLQLEDTLMTYTVTAEDTEGCIVKDSVTIKALNFQVGIVPVDANAVAAYCPTAGDDLYFKVANNRPSLTQTVQWSPASAIKTSDKGNMTAHPLSDVTYKLSATLVNGCKADAEISVDVIEMPGTAGRDTSICIGDSIFIGDKNVYQSPDLIYSYYWNSGNVIDNVPYTKVAPSVKDTFILVITADKIDNSASCSKYDTVIISVNKKPVVSAGKDTMVCKDAVAKLVASPSGVAITSVWSTGDQSSIINPVITTSRKFSVTVTDQNNCSDTASVLVSVDPYIVKPLADPTDVCPDEKFSLKDTAAATVKWEWSASQDNAVISNRLARQTEAKLEQTTLFTVKGTNSRMCSHTAQVEVKQKGVNVSAGIDQEYCEGFEATLTGLPVGPFIPAKIWWKPAQGIIDTTQNTQVLKPAAGINQFIVFAEDANCKSSDTVFVVINEKPQAILAGPLAICRDTIVTVKGNPTATGGTGTLKYSWSFTGSDNVFAAADKDSVTVSPTTTSTYQVIVSDLNACSDTATWQIVRKDQFAVQIMQDKPIVCENDSLILSIDPMFIGSTIVWKDLNTSQILANDTISLKVRNESSYSVNVMDKSGCENSQSQFVNFITPPSLLNIKAESATCADQPVRLVAEVNGENISYQWFSEGAGLYSDTLNDTTFYQHSIGDKNILALTVKAFNFCDTISDTTFMKFLSVPVADFDSDPKVVEADNVISFINKSDSLNYTWTWNFNDGSQEVALKDPGHIYINPGQFEVTLIAANNAGCRDTVRKSVEVIRNPDFEIAYLPNVLNPDASDPENRVAKLYGNNLSVDGFEIKIFNRWGELIYLSKDLNTMNKTGWNGINQNTGLSQQNGVFTYVMKGKFVSGKEFNREGTITILR